MTRVDEDDELGVGLDTGHELIKRKPEILQRKRWSPDFSPNRVRHLLKHRKPRFCQHAMITGIQKRPQDQLDALIRSVREQQAFRSRPCVVRELVQQRTVLRVQVQLIGAGELHQPLSHGFRRHQRHLVELHELLPRRITRILRRRIGGHPCNGIPDTQGQGKFSRRGRTCV